MNKSELIASFANDAGLSPEEAAMMVNTFVGCMQGALVDDGRIEIRGFGSFKIKRYKGYKGRNPKTGASVEVRPKRLPFFRAGKEFKEMLNS